MVRAGGLYFAIFIVFIFTILVSFFFIGNMYNNLHLEKIIEDEKYSSALISGKNMFFSDPDRFMYNIPYEMVLFEDDPESKILLQRRDWGVFDILKISAGENQSQYSEINLIGYELNKSDKTALYVSDQKEYISVCGNTTIKGECHLPALGMQENFINGEAFRGKVPDKEDIFISRASLPSLDIANRPGLKNGNMEHDGNENVIRIRTRVYSQDLSNSFSEDAIILHSENELFLNNVSLEGNVKIASSKSIYVLASCNLKDIILQAPIIYFEDNFEGSLQAFANDTLIVGRNCNFINPSCLCINNTNINQAYMYLGKNSKLYGSLILIRQIRTEQPSKLKIENTGEVIGQVYWDGQVELNGNIKGSLYCSSFILVNKSGIYKNHIYNSSIDRSALPESFVGIKIEKNGNDLRCIKRLL